MELLEYILRRILLAIPIFLAASILVFLLIHMAPGDPVEVLISPKLGEEAVEQRKQELGLNKPLYVQYFKFMKRFLSGNLGRSIFLQKPVSVLLAERLPPTLRLNLASLVLSYLIAIPAGIIAAMHRGQFLDYAVMGVALLGIAMPSFWLGLLLMLLFSVKLGWLPVSGYGSLAHLVLPAITLGAYGAALTSRVVRSNMLEVINKDYITTARAKGLKELLVVCKHAVRNALIPVISLLGLRIGWLIGGAVTIEVVFHRLGVGRLMINSIYRRDYPVVQAIILILAISVILGNLLADILYGLINPKIRYK
ncbi:MAG: ABC transporter permease [Candidatus Bipolaricaulia bacterium]